MKDRILYIVTILLILFSACNNDETDDLFSEYITSQALLSDITITLTEQTQLVDSVQADEEGIYLYIETTKIYPYCNYGILRSTFQTGDTLLIRLEDVVKPGVMISPEGSANTSIKIPDNTKHIIFLRGHETNNFDLQIEEDALLLHPVFTSFSVTDHLIYLRNTETVP